MTSKKLVTFMIAASSTTFNLAALASTQTQHTTVCDSEQTGEDADCDVVNEPGPGVPPIVQCTYTPIYGQVCHDVTYTVEVPTTPVGVNRFVNPSTGLHYFTTGSTAPTGYIFEEHAFSLANDNGYGAVPFTMLSSGSGFFFSNQSAISGLVPIYGYFNPRKGETFNTTNPNDVNGFPCLSAYCIYNPQTGSCNVVLPDCYYASGIFGYVGP